MNEDRVRPLQAQADFVSIFQYVNHSLEQPAQGGRKTSLQVSRCDWTGWWTISAMVLFLHENGPDNLLRSLQNRVSLQFSKTTNIY